MRQVRLDDDVATLVEEYQEAEGLKSLSASANRMIRLAAGPEEPEPEEPAPEPERPPRPASTTVTVPRPHRRASFPPTTPPTFSDQVAAGMEAGLPQVRAAAQKVVDAARRCPHPILARRADRCGACGATL